MKYYILSLFLLLISCNTKTPAKNEPNGPTYLQLVQKKYASIPLNDIKISFNTNKDASYTIEKKNNRSFYTMSREYNDTKYFASYDNGLIKYFINDSLQNDKSYNRLFLDVNLDAFIYNTLIPHSFKGNDILVDKLTSVTIRNKEYIPIYVHTKEIVGLKKDEFILYVEPETYVIKYIAQNFYQSNPSPVFKNFYNHRVINGILFADYYTLKPKVADLELEQLYEKFNSVDLEEIGTTLFTDIKVNQLQ